MIIAVQYSIVQYSTIQYIVQYSKAQYRKVDSKVEDSVVNYGTVLYSKLQCKPSPFSFSFPLCMQVSNSIIIMKCWNATDRVSVSTSHRLTFTALFLPWLRCFREDRVSCSSELLHTAFRRTSEMKCFRILSSLCLNWGIDVRRSI